MLADTPSVEKDQNVYDANHEHVGKVEEIAETWMHVQSGLFGWVQHHVPFGLVSHVDHEGVHLNVDRSQLEAVEKQTEHSDEPATEPSSTADTPSPIGPGGSEVAL